jgi:hypothetical protein
MMYGFEGYAPSPIVAALEGFARDAAAILSQRLQ